MAEIPEQTSRPRPYFIPASIDFDALPEAVQVVMVNVVGPTYEELVLGAATALERSAGVTLTFLLALEVLDQFEIGNAMGYTGLANSTDMGDREQRIARHLRLVAAKQQAASFMMRLRLVRATRFSDPLRKSPI